ncbi:MAG: BNR-4 repeat-containing protein [Pseudomonadota bacterium]
MKNYKLIGLKLLLLISVVGCGGATNEQNKVENRLTISEQKIANIEIEPLGDFGSWYFLGDYGDGVPGYSGGVATYSAHHTPIAIHHNGISYYLFSDNTEGGLKIKLKRNNENAVLIDHLRYIDPHRNASLSIDDDGYIYVYISARGNNEPSLTYRSKEPESLRFEQLEQSTFAYPQPWHVEGEQVVLFSNYEVAENLAGKLRTLYVNSPECSQKLVEGGHYQVSYYDGNRLFSFYNWTPEGRVTTRHNLYYIESSDGGCTWQNAGRQALELPLNEDSEHALLYKTQPENLYPVDAYVLNGEPAALFIQSENASPRRGPYDLYVWRNGVKEFVTQVGHQYNTGFMYEENGREFIVTPTLGLKDFAGGRIGLFERVDGEWVLADEINDGGNYNYIRRVYNGGGEAILTEAASDKESPALLYRLRLELKTSP